MVALSSKVNEMDRASVRLDERMKAIEATLDRVEFKLDQVLNQNTPVPGRAIGRQRTGGGHSGDEG